MVELEGMSPGLRRPFRSQSSEVDAALARYSSFYREYTPALMMFLICQGASPADAAEIVQDTMTKVWASWSTIEFPKAWARKVAGRAWVSHRVSNEDSVATVPEKSAVLAECEQLTVWAQRHDLLRVLPLLPPRQRQIMAWTFLELTPAEIAKELHMAENTVRSNLREARKNMARHLRRMNEES
ncbi:RNA polymerase sigma factor [Nocardia takedensis]|uniref:RNA polymerase sigma factor n=1 Tax=Nocardia takedensis TaxID=259390 RepID=UPI003F759884